MNLRKWKPQANLRWNKSGKRKPCFNHKEIPLHALTKVMDLNINMDQTSRKNAGPNDYVLKITEQQAIKKFCRCFVGLICPQFYLATAFYMEHQKDRKEKELCWLGSERFQNHQAISTIYSNTTIMEYTIDAQLKTTHASIVKRRNFAHMTL